MLTVTEGGLYRVQEWEPHCLEGRSRECLALKTLLNTKELSGSDLIGQNP